LARFQSESEGASVRCDNEHTRAPAASDEEGQMPNVTQTEKRGASLDALRAHLAGDVFAPGDEGWDEARRAWNLAVDQQPAAVALPESAEDVVAIVKFARRRGYRVAPQGTGHAAPPLGSLEGTILVKTERMRDVEVDPEARVARVDAGVIWIEVVEAAAEHGLAALAGSAPDVGVVGYSLGGGVSFLARKHGLSTNNVLAVDVVTADGRLMRADAENHPDLFWALRGGGGSFGIVTAVEIRLFPLTHVYAGALFFPVERASEVLQTWREWLPSVPRELTSIGRIMQFPPIPDVPEPFRGNSYALVEIIYAGDEAEGAELVEPLRALGPAIDTVEKIPLTKLSELHMDPPFPVPARGDGFTLDELTEETVEAVVELAVGSPFVSFEVRHMGGALAEAKPEHGALASLDVGFLGFAVGIPMTPEIGEAIEAQLDRMHERLAPWKSRQMYLNFRERSNGSSEFYRPDVYRRLRRIKARYDASELIRSNHPIAPERVRRVARTRRASAPALTR
jgi:FAD/FMN-containing dehydrogenase